MSTVRISVIFLIGALLGSAGAARAEDAKGSKDHPRVSRFKGSEIDTYKASDFGLLNLLLSNPGKSQKVQAVEGKLAFFVYKIPEGHDSHEVFRSYEGELGKGGYETLYRCVGAKACGDYDFASYIQDTFPTGAMGGIDIETQRYLAARRQAPEGDSYVMLFAWSDKSGRSKALLNVVDVAELNKGLVTVSAEAMARDIGADGHYAIYGITFATDSATVKPDSDATLKEMAKLLTDNPSLKVFIVGHTDNAGALARNLDLSQRRAEAVVKMLATKYGIAAGRLEGRGAGPIAPVATNKTEAGRAKNRRVELVER